MIMQEFEQLKAIIEDIKVLIYAMKKKEIAISEIQNVKISVEEINKFLYHSERLKMQREYRLEEEAEYHGYIKELELLTEIWERTMIRQKGKSTDREFWDIYEYFKYVDIDRIYQTAVNRFMNLPEGQRIEYLSLPHRYTFLQNKIDFTQKDFSLIGQHVELMANGVEKYRWLYEHLADYRSKEILNGIVRYWFEFDIRRLHSLCETVFADYYDLDILECGEEDVIVDLGAFVGDSICDYIETYGSYKKIYAYEITPSTCQTLVQNMSQYPDIIIRQKGAGSERKTMFVNDEGHKAGNRLQEKGEQEIEVVPLDEDVKELITVIKMDIEGAEREALLGAKRHIMEEKPRLLISSYHLPEDIFELPYLIHSIRDDYKFYMRFNGRGCLWPCDYVLFAV